MAPDVIGNNDEMQDYSNFKNSSAFLVKIDSPWQTDD